MILKASQRAYGAELAAHLLNAEDNEHITLHEMRGFVSDDLAEAFQEVQAMARATRCQQYLFSLNLNPPADADVSIADFENTADRIEARLGLTGQPRAMVLHEKEGRLHAHCVWSRIDTEEMKAVHLPYFKTKLMEIAHDLFLEHGWDMPQGLAGFAPDPKNYELPEYQQAKRVKQDPQELKAMFQTCWSQSDSAASFRAALLEQGFALARGDRRGFVAVDTEGEVYSLSRWCGVKSKDLKERLGEPANYPNVEEAREALVAQQAEAKTAQEDQERRNAYERKLEALNAAKAKMIEHHRAARARLLEQQRERQKAETRTRAARFARGFKGIWQWVTGNRAKIRRQNEIEAKDARMRDLQERQNLATNQRRERRSLNHQIRDRRLQWEYEVARRDMAHTEIPHISKSRNGPTLH